MNGSTRRTGGVTVFESLADAAFARPRSTSPPTGAGRATARPCRSSAAWRARAFFFYNLFSSDRTGAPLSWRNRAAGSVDAYAAAVGRWLVTRDAFDFLLFYLSDYDYASHERGPTRRSRRCGAATTRSARSPRRPAGSRSSSSATPSSSWPTTARRACARPSRSPRSTPASRACSRSASNRAGAPLPPARLPLDPRAVAARLDGVAAAEVTLFREGGDAVARRDGEELVFAPARGRLHAIAATPRSSTTRTRSPRLGGAPDPNAGEVLVSAAEGHEFADLGGGTMSEVAPMALSSRRLEVPLLSVDVEGTRRRASPTSLRSSSPISASRRPPTLWVRRRTEPLPSPNVIEPPATISTQGTAQRVGSALGRRSNWEQLAKFCVVGASGYAVNLAVYALLFRCAGLHYLPAAVGSFLVAVANNYTLNRLWTFKEHQGNVAYQGRGSSSSRRSRWEQTSSCSTCSSRSGSARFSRRRSRSSS